MTLSTSLSVFDLPEALDRCRGKKPFLAELVGIFLEDAAIQGAALEAACAALALPDMERTSHRLKGSAANVSLKRVAAVATRLENLAREEDEAAAAALWPELKAELAEGEKALRAFLDSADRA